MEGRCTADNQRCILGERYTSGWTLKEPTPQGGWGQSLPTPADGIGQGVRASSACRVPSVPG